METLTNISGFHVKQTYKKMTMQIQPAAKRFLIFLASKSGNMFSTEQSASITQSKLQKRRRLQSCHNSVKGSQRAGQTQSKHLGGCICLDSSRTF